MPSRRFIDRCTDGRLTLTDEEIREVTRRMEKVGTTDKTIMAASLVGIPITIATGIGGGVLFMHAAEAIGLSRSNAILIAGLLFAPVMTALWFVVFTRMYRRHIRAVLVDMGHPVCEFCGYLLEGVDGPVCPECGRKTAVQEGS